MCSLYFVWKFSLYFIVLDKKIKLFYEMPLGNIQLPPGATEKEVSVSLLWLSGAPPDEPEEPQHSLFQYLLPVCNFKDFLLATLNLVPCQTLWFLPWSIFFSLFLYISLLLSSAVCGRSLTWRINRVLWLLMTVGRLAPQEEVRGHRAHSQLPV